MSILLRPQGVDVQSLVGIDSAVTDLRMREKTRFVWIFLLTYLSICLSVRFFVAAGHSFGAIFTLKRRDFATVSAFWWSH